MSYVCNTSVCFVLLYTALHCCTYYILIVVDLSSEHNPMHTRFSDSRKSSLKCKIIGVFGRLKSLAKSNRKHCWRVWRTLSRIGWWNHHSFPFVMGTVVSASPITKCRDDQIMPICFRLFSSFIRFSDNFFKIVYVIEHRNSGHAPKPIPTMLTCNKNRCSLE